MAFKMTGIDFGEGTGSAFTKKDDTKLPSDSTLTINTADSDRLEGEILGIYDNEYNEAKMDNDSTKIKNLENLMLKMKNKVIERGDGELFTKDKSHIDMSKFNSPMKQKTDLFKGKTTKAEKDREYAEMIERSKKTWSKQRLIDYERTQRWRKNHPSERKIAKGKTTDKLLSKKPLTGKRVTSERSYYNPITKRVHRSNWVGWKTDY